MELYQHASSEQNQCHMRGNARCAAQTLAVDTLRGLQVHGSCQTPSKGVDNVLAMDKTILASRTRSDSSKIKLARQRTDDVVCAIQGCAATGKHRVEWRLTIDECVEDELPVLVDQVVDVSKDATGSESVVWKSWRGCLQHTYHIVEELVGREGCLCQ